MANKVYHKITIESGDKSTQESHSLTYYDEGDGSAATFHDVLAMMIQEYYIDDVDEIIGALKKIQV